MLKSRILNIFIFVFLSVPSVLFAKSKELEYPSINQSLETLETALSGVIVEQGKLYLLPYRKHFYIETPFLGEFGTRESTFGKLSDSKRIKFKELENFGPWQGGFIKKDLLTFLDGNMIGFNEINEEFKTAIFRGIIYDRIRPPVDHGGNAPEFEVKEFTTNFLHKLRNTKGQKFTGIAVSPSDNELLLQSRIKNFPLLLLSCDANKVAQCTIKDKCNLFGFDHKRSAFLTGIGFSKKEKIVAIALSDNNEIELYKFQNCYNSKKIASLKLPSKLKTISSLTIDENDRLWVTTTFRDDYNNASLYYWKKEQWVTQ